MATTNPPLNTVYLLVIKLTQNKEINHLFLFDGKKRKMTPNRQTTKTFPIEDRGLRKIRLAKGKHNTSGILPNFEVQNKREVSMIKSMTGFGKSICELPTKRVIIEIKSLNSKQLDINTRIPNLYREKDLAIRNAISQKLQRGKIDVTFYVESMVPDKIPQVNEEVISAYHRQLKNVTDKLEINNTDLLRIIMPLPDTMKTPQAELDEKEWNAVSVALDEAISQLDTFRLQEGNSMQKDVQLRNKSIEKLLEQINPYEKQRTEKIRNRIKENLSEYKSNSAVDENRFEQELIYYLEKLDISEEKVRLLNHIQYFNETLNDDGPVGKKLGFIVQEMGREINTLGSKANDAEIQHIVVKMKDDLEKIKEQILNIL